MIDPDAPQDVHEAPQAPPIPSFDSLRDPRRRSPLDLLVPPPVPPEPDPAPAPVVAPRPPDYGDLLNLAVHLARWTVGLPLRGLRKLLGS